MTSGNVVTKEFFAKEITLTKVVLESAEAVFNPNKEVIQVFKKKFAPGANKSSASSSAAAGTIAVLGSSPPTATTQDLQHLAFIKSIPPTIIHRVQARDDYTPMRNEVSALLGPIKDLASACRGRLNGVKQRKEAQQALQEKKYGDIGGPTVLLCYNDAFHGFIVIVRMHCF